MTLMLLISPFPQRRTSLTAYLKIYALWYSVYLVEFPRGRNSAAVNSLASDCRHKNIETELNKQNLPLDFELVVVRDGVCIVVWSSTVLLKLSVWRKPMLAVNKA